MAKVGAFLLGLCLGMLFVWLHARDAWTQRDVAQASLRYARERIAAQRQECGEVWYRLHYPDPEEFKPHRWDGLPPDMKKRLEAKWAAEDKAP